ncbi:hypothetical protein [Cellulomonas sp. GbtcB1]|uniref:hypothetical protein n=1 Tax=Cellulomonas sp. GbtcB1 TaxID=2824746 RepID=UPI001C2F95F6|nr:hypothetical protein [Cellulomonas sp. GbtcB1]
MTSTRDRTGPAPLLTPALLRARGEDVDGLARSARQGALHRVRRGVYCPASSWDAADEAHRHLLRVQAAADALQNPVFSHRSAAAVWGLPLIGPWPRDVEVVAPSSSGGRSAPGVRRRTAAPVPAPVLTRGLPVTDLSRTVVDLACTEPFASAVVAADHALGRMGLDPDAARAVLASRGSARGARRAREVLAFADGRSESPGESLSRVRMREVGAPVPVLQQELRDGDGFVARVDFWWVEHRLVGEFDGRLKYRADGPRDGRSVEERVWAEKRREDRIRSHGVRVIRWTWQDAMDPDAMRRVLGAAGLLDRGAGRRAR